jgi:hypothetical protein
MTIFFPLVKLPSSSNLPQLAELERTVQQPEDLLLSFLFKTKYAIFGRSDSYAHWNFGSKAQELVHARADLVTNFFRWKLAYRLR